MSVRKSLFAVSAMLLVLAALLPTVAASAHERRQVGDIWMIVGWKVEPALKDEPNSLDMRVFRLKPGTDPATQTAADRLPILGLEKTLKADLLYGADKKKELTVTARFNDPGAYDGVVFPNTAGDYTFRIYGTVEGQSVDQKFNSADKKFGAIEDTAAMQFPAAPESMNQVLVKLEDLQKEVDASKAALAAADTDSGSSSNGLAIVALIVGALGIAVGGFAVIKK